MYRTDNVSFPWDGLLPEHIYSISVLCGSKCVIVETQLYVVSRMTIHVSTSHCPPRTP